MVLNHLLCFAPLGLFVFRIFMVSVFLKGSQLLYLCLKHISFNPKSIDGVKMLGLNVVVDNPPTLRYSPILHISPIEMFEKWKFSKLYPTTNCWWYNIKSFCKVTGDKLRLLIDGRYISITPPFFDCNYSISCADVFAVIFKRQFFARIDISNAFNEINLILYDSIKSLPLCYRTKFGSTFYWRDIIKGVIYGWKYSPWTLLKLLNCLLKDISDEENEIFIYMDDIIISSDKSDNIDNIILRIGHRLSVLGLTIDPKKTMSNYMKSDGKIFGYLYNSKLNNFTQEVRFKLHNSVKLHDFGKFCDSQNFVNKSFTFRELAELVAAVVYDPLKLTVIKYMCNIFLSCAFKGNDLSTKDWDSRISNEVYDKLISCMSEAFLLFPSNVCFAKQSLVHVYCDASNNNIAVRVKEMIGMGRVYILSHQERDWPIWVKELASIVLALRYIKRLYKFYLINDCILYTDSQIAYWVIYNKKCKPKGEAILKQALYLLKDLKIEIRYVESKNNIADKWSRFTCKYIPKDNKFPSRINTSCF